MESVNWSCRFATDVTLSVGSLVPDRALETTSPVFEGMQVIISLDGRRSSRVNGSAPFAIEEPGAYLVLASGGHEGCDRVEPGALQRFVRIAIDPQSAARNGFDLAAIAASGCRRLHSHDIIVMHHPLTPTMKAIAMQALVCPLKHGPMRDVYLAGKSLELAAVTADAVMQGDTRRTRLSNGDLERLWHARELVVEHYQQPPSLHDLARQVGTNVNKLTAGFRQVFGMSVFEYIQQHRLQEAYRMLSTGAYSVSEVAAFVGYAIPHFSTLFRKRFGFPPSQLTH